MRRKQSYWWDLITRQNLQIWYALKVQDFKNVLLVRLAFIWSPEKKSFVRPWLMIQYSEEKTVVLKIFDHQEEHSDMTRWSFKILKSILVYWRDFLVTVFPGSISRYNRFLKIQASKAVIVKILAISQCLEQSPSRPCLMIQYNEENTVVLKRHDPQKESPFMFEVLSPERISSYISVYCGGHSCTEETCCHMIPRSITCLTVLNIQEYICIEETCSHMISRLYLQI